MIDFVSMNSLEYVVIDSPDSPIYKECPNLDMSCRLLKANFNDFCNWVAGWYPDCKDMVFTINGKNPNSIEDINTTHTIRTKIVHDLSKRDNRSMTLGEWHQMILDGISNGLLDPDLEIYFTRANVEKKESIECNYAFEFFVKTCKINLDVDCSQGIIAMAYEAKTINTKENKDE